MTWVAAGVGAATVVSGVISGNKASKLQKQELQLKRDTLNFQKQRYSDAESLYGDSIQGLVNLANEDVNPDLDGVTSRALADVTTQFGNSQEIIARRNARMGVNPNSGQAQSAMRQTALAEALAKAGTTSVARQQERVNAENKHWSRLNTVASMGVNQMNGTANNLTNSADSLANSYGSSANAYNSAASNAIGTGLSSIIGADWSSLRAKTASPASTPVAMEIA